MNDSEIIQTALMQKAARVYDKVNPYLSRLGIKDYYAGGGCFADVVNDYDIFPVVDGGLILKSFHTHADFVVLYRSSNATTIKGKDIIIQLCQYYHPSLQHLVDSFDFIHCQIGMHVQDGALKAGYCSDAYVMYKMTGTSGYTTSAYPLSSLFRCFKYHDRGTLTGRAWRMAVIKILSDIVARGFGSYKDFKDQMDAVDLHYTEDDFDYAELMRLFNLLGGKK